MRIGFLGMPVVVSACGGLGDRGGEGLAAFDGFAAWEIAEEQVAMGPRFPGSPGHEEIQRWLDDGLVSLDWEVARQAFMYDGTPLLNLIGSRAEMQGPLILLGAHYDTRPVADRDPDHPTSPVPGANDGASGVAVLLELARVLPSAGFACDIRLAFFDGEDSGGIDGWEWAVGSRHMADSWLEEPQAVVVVDMVGDADLRLPREGNSTPALMDSIWAAAREVGLTAFVDDPGPSLLDDHRAFLDRGWPAVDIIDFTYPHWHTTEDTMDKISPDSLEQVGRALLTWLATACRGSLGPAS